MTMSKYRVRATCVQVFTQFFTVEANNQLEAIELVKRGEARLAYERFEEVDEFEPTHAYVVHDNSDPSTPTAPSRAYAAPQPRGEEPRRIPQFV